MGPLRGETGEAEKPARAPTSSDPPLEGGLCTSFQKDAKFQADPERDPFYLLQIAPL